jgi:hypothetical protein
MMVLVQPTAQRSSNNPADATREFHAAPRQK